MRTAIVLLLLFIARAASAQPIGVDRILPAWHSHQRAADWISAGTVAAALVLDAVDSWKAPARTRALVLDGTRIGVTFGATWALKRLVHRARPCAPSCGRDDPRASFPSAHTAFAATAMGGPRLLFTLPLSTGTGLLRVFANKHFLTDTLPGWAIGAAAGHWIR